MLLDGMKPRKYAFTYVASNFFASVGASGKARLWQNEMSYQYEEILVP